MSKTTASALGMAAASLRSESEQFVCAHVRFVLHFEHQGIKQTVVDAAQMVSCIRRQHRKYYTHAWEDRILVM